MSDRRQFLKNLAGITAGAVIAPKLVSELLEEIEPLDPEIIVDDLPTYPSEGSIQTTWNTLVDDSDCAKANESTIELEELHKKLVELKTEYLI